MDKMELVRRTGILNACGMPREPQPYKLVLARNVAAQRTRMQLRQSELAARMRALGWRSFYPQTVSEIEAGSRAIRAEELLGLEVALDTTIKVLTAAPPGVASVELPNGEILSAQRVSDNDFSVTWEDDRPKITPPAEPGPGIDTLIAERRREVAALEAFRDEQRHWPEGKPLPPGPDAEDILPPIPRPDEGTDDDQGR
jgi:transcriptional regulator with XRE-family HTH domain